MLCVSSYVGFHHDGVTSMDRFSTDTKQENYWTHTGCIENFGRNERLPARTDQYKNALQWRAGGQRGICFVRLAVKRPV